MEIIRKGSPGEGKRVRDFADLCFGVEAAENRFEILIPKLYREPEETVKEHILLEKDGELKGLLLAQTMTWNVDGRELLTGHIVPCAYPRIIGIRAL